MGLCCKRVKFDGVLNMRIKWKQLLLDIKEATSHNQAPEYINSMIDAYVEAKASETAKIKKWIERIVAITYFGISLILYFF